MKQIFTSCLIALVTIHAYGQKTMHQVTAGILAKQVQPQAAWKTTATAKRLVGYSRYDGAIMTDSAFHKYRAMQGSILTDYFSYLGVNLYYSYNYFDPADPLAIHSIPSDTSIFYKHDGTALLLDKLLANDYDSKRNPTHTFDYTEDQTVERFITSNSLGQRSTVIERDSGDGTQPYIDRIKHHFTYDNQNRIIKDSAYSIPGAVTFSKTDYHYNSAGLLSDYIRYIDLGGPLSQDYKIEFGYDGSNRLITAVDYYDFGSGWKATNRFSYAYTGSASQYTKFTIEDWSGSNWSPVNAEIYELNSSGLISRRYRLETPGSTLDTMYRLDYTHNSAGLLENAQGAKYLGNGNYGPNDQAEHFYYEDYQTSGIDDIKQQGAFIIYPNPANSTIRMRLNKTAYISIYNQDGNTVKVIPEVKDNQIIDISDLACGKYYITLDKGTAQQLLIMR